MEWVIITYLVNVVVCFVYFCFEIVPQLYSDYKYRKFCLKEGRDYSAVVTWGGIIRPVLITITPGLNTLVMTFRVIPDTFTSVIDKISDFLDKPVVGKGKKQ